MGENSEKDEAEKTGAPEGGSPESGSPESGSPESGSAEGGDDPGKLAADALSEAAEAGPKDSARTAAVKKARARRGDDRTTKTIPAIIGVLTAALVAVIVYDYVRSRDRLAVPPPPEEVTLGISKRHTAPGGWLHGLRRVAVEDDRPWVQVGMEVGRRGMAPEVPVAPAGTGLKESFLSVALFTDGTYVQMKSLESGDVRALVCAGGSERYGAVRELLKRCSAGGSAIALFLVRVGDAPAAIEVTLGALPVAKRKVVVEVFPEGDSIKVVANRYACTGLGDLREKLDKLRAGGKEEPTFVKLSVSDELPFKIFVESVLACGAPKETVYVALSPQHR